MKDQVIRMKSTTNPARSGFISFNTEEMGAYLKKVNSYKSLDSAEEKEIARKAKNESALGWKSNRGEKSGIISGIDNETFACNLCGSSKMYRNMSGKWRKLF